MRRDLVWKDAKRNAFRHDGWELTLFARTWITTDNRWRVSTTDWRTYCTETFDTYAEAVNFIEALWALEDCDEND